MPRQHILKKLGPKGSKCVEEVDDALLPLINEYVAIVFNNEPPLDSGVEYLLDIYESFHLLEWTTPCGKVPLQCTCVHPCHDCNCEHGTFFTSIFDSDLQVPSDYVEEEPRLHKKCHKIKCSEWPNRRLLQVI